MPLRLTRPLAVTTIRTVISLRVRVPVLSDAMMFAEPRVSTAARWRTMAFRFAMRCTPRASTAVTTAGSPSGTVVMIATIILVEDVPGFQGLFDVLILGVALVA